MTFEERKQPQQVRAQETVRAILEATVQILDREGLAAATTTRIAEVAGVSIGSLYQYFSHRDAILNALQDREFERTIALMQKVLGNASLDQTPAKTVSLALHGLADLYAGSAGLHRVLTVEGLRVSKAEHVHAFDRRVVDLVRHFLSATEAPIRRSNLEAAAFVVYQSVRATMLAFLLEQPPGLDVESVIEELTSLIIEYLIGPQGSPRASRSPAAAKSSGRSKAKRRR